MLFICMHYLIIHVQWASRGALSWEARTAFAWKGSQQSAEQSTFRVFNCFCVLLVLC